jgi:putative selenate reductase
MAKLVPIPFDVLVTRLFGELERRQTIFDLPVRRFVLPDPARDYSVSIHGHRASTPLGPAAGPQTQLAQNIVLSWLSGGRVLELKTVQVKDDLVIARPCIDMRTVGFNVEWSQELRVKESLEEYVKGSMLIAMLKASGVVKGLPDMVLDMSVGYDLAGIRSERVRAFMAGMMDARSLVDRLRREIPDRYRHLRDLEFETHLSDTLTLSTFHGCPPHEIERICEFLLEEVGLHVVVKLNPTLLGQEELGGILHDRLGYRHLVVPEQAFAKDARWEEVVGFVERLGARSKRLGRGFGVKFTNTLIVENREHFLPATEKEMYLSGPPLHALAFALVRRFRKTFGEAYPISFSGGIDAGNFPDAVALGLKPVTVCSDWLKPGGYARGTRYFSELSARMKAVGAADVDLFGLVAYGHAEEALRSLGLPEPVMACCLGALAEGGDLRAAAGDGFSRWVSAARLLGTETYGERLLENPRYAAKNNAVPPKKVGSTLKLFDCLTCDKCIPVCPNDANFSLPVAGGDIAIEKLIPTGTGFLRESAGVLSLKQPRQIANHADACNDCGNCDVMCPEDGGPYVLKPRFFGSVEGFLSSPGQDGMAFERLGDVLRMHGRFEGRSFVVETGGKRLVYRGDGFAISFDPKDPGGTAEGHATGPVDLTFLRIMERIREALEKAGPVTYVGAGLAESGLSAAH